MFLLIDYGSHKCTKVAKRVIILATAIVVFNVAFYSELVDQ